MLKVADALLLMKAPKSVSSEPAGISVVYVNVYTPSVKFALGTVMETVPSPLLTAPGITVAI